VDQRTNENGIVKVCMRLDSDGRYQSPNPIICIQVFIKKSVQTPRKVYIYN